jgi:uncharacterized secreted protein with C-terminal beta-propeller domain
MARRSALVAGTVVAAVAGIGAAQLLPGAAPTAQASGLVGYDGCRELLAHYRAELTRSATAYGFGFGYGGVAVDMPAADASVGGVAERSSGGPDAVGSGPTGTNVQEQGVDEPDLVKLRDGRLVVFTGNRVRVLSADAQPRLLGSLRIGGDQAYGGELLLDGDRAVALVPGYRQDDRTQETPSGDDVARSMIWNPGTPTTRVLLLDLSGDQPRLVEESTYDAQYVSARLVDGTVRLVTTTRPQPVAYYPQEGTAFDEAAALRSNQSRAAAVTLAEVLPQVVRRSADGTVQDRGNAVECDRTYHARTPSGVSTLMVTTMRPGDGLAPTDGTAVTTDGDLVYASADRLYVATSRWGTVGPVMPLARGVAADSRPLADEVSTELHAFDTSSPTVTTYVGTGTVPGYVMGRWALSSYDGALRVATTRQPPWDGERTGDSSSMLVKLVERDGRLVETGRVGGLGRTEQIKAVRYFGDVAAVVTFRQTDPLYLLNLSGTPKVLGELKIPGFSTYLHPIGDGLLLGLGHDADRDGGVTGVQVSVFDIADLSRPTQVDRVHLGPGWTPALDDSRAFTYDPGNRLATFAFSSYDPSTGSGQRTTALGVSVDGSGQVRVAGRLDLAQETWAARVLLDDDKVFAVSETGVVAGDTGTWDRTGSVRFDATPLAVE